MFLSFNPDPKGPHMPVPFVDLPLQIRNLRPELDAAIARVLDRAAFLNGPFVREFEEAFAAAVGTRHAVAASSGTTALHLALLACGVKPGDAVITTPLTFIATAEAILHCGATPVFVDVLEDTGLLNPDLLDAAITPAVRAILPVHLYGRPCDMEKITAIARAHNLAIVEDAAQAHGATRSGRLAGTFGDAACFSFFPGKNLGAFGDAGILVTDSDTLAADARARANHGRQRKYEHTLEGYNYRMDDMQAAILSVKLKHLDDWNRARVRHAETYDRALSGIPHITCPPLNTAACASVFHLYVIRTPHRDALQAHLKQNGIESGIHYPIPLHRQPVYATRDFARAAFPAAEKMCSEILSLPMFPEMTEEQIATVADAVRCFSS